MALANPPAKGEVEVMEDLSPAERRHFKALEGRIERGLTMFIEVGNALLEIRDQRLYRLSHASFEAYCTTRWGLDRARAYQLMGAAEVAAVFPTGKGPVNEVQARELVPLVHKDPKLVTEVWSKIESGGKPITAPLVREAVREVSGEVINGNGKPVTPVTPTTRLIASMRRLGQEFGAWKGLPHSRADTKAVTAAFADLTKLVKS